MSTEVLDTIKNERTDLALHVDLCEQRYQQLIGKFDTVDTRLDKIETHITEIRDLIGANRRDDFRMFLGWASVIIATLTGTCAWLITHYVLK